LYIQRAITTLKTFFLQQQPLRKQIVWGSQPFVYCLEKLFQDFRQCSSALYLQERFCSFVCCFRSLSPPSPGRGAFACESLSSVFFLPLIAIFLLEAGERSRYSFCCCCCLTYSATVEVSSSKMVKRESTQVENESGKAYHLISKVYPMTLVCRLQRCAPPPLLPPSSTSPPSCLSGL
jgi:hypothetical protein